MPREVGPVVGHLLQVAIGHRAEPLKALGEHRVGVWPGCGDRDGAGHGVRFGQADPERPPPRPVFPLPDLGASRTQVWTIQSWLAGMCQGVKPRRFWPAAGRKVHSDGRRSRA